MKSHEERQDSCHDDSSATSLSKQPKVTENTGSLSINVQVLDGASPDISALLCVHKAPVAGNCRQDGMGSEAVSSDVDFGGLDDEFSGFYDILKTINGCEFTSEFQKCLSESERDDSNVHLSSGDLMCLSVSDVTDAVSAPHHGIDESIPSQPSLQTTTVSFQFIEPLHVDTKYVEVPCSTETLAVDNFHTPVWHENLPMHESVLHHWQQLQTSVSATWPDSYDAELLKYEAVSVKRHPSLRRQLQFHDAYSLSRTQSCQQQQPQLNQAQSLYLSDTAQQLLEQQRWTQQDWQTATEWVHQAQQQLLPGQSVASLAVKKEMPWSVIVSSVNDGATAVRVPEQISENTGYGLLPHAYAANANVAVAAPPNRSHVSIYASCQPRVFNCNQSLQPHPDFLMNQSQKGGFVNLSQVPLPEFGSALNFMPHGAAGQLFGPAGESNRLRVVADDSDSACPAVSDVMLVSAHQLIENENIPANPQSTGR